MGRGDPDMDVPGYGGKSRIPSIGSSRYCPKGWSGPMTDSWSDMREGRVDKGKGSTLSSGSFSGKDVSVSDMMSPTLSQ